MRNVEEEEHVEMTVLEAPKVATDAPQQSVVGPIGRLGGWAADHLRAVALGWAAVAVALAVFAPQVETALSGAGWQANGSESVAARDADPAELRGPLQLRPDGRAPLVLPLGR